MDTDPKLTETTPGEVYWDHTLKASWPHLPSFLCSSSCFLHPCYISPSLFKQCYSFYWGIYLETKSKEKVSTVFCYSLNWVSPKVHVFRTWSLDWWNLENGSFGWSVPVGMLFKETCGTEFFLSVPRLTATIPHQGGPCDFGPDPP